MTDTSPKAEDIKATPAAGKPHEHTVPVAVMRAERQARKAAEDLCERVLETAQKQTELITAQQAQIESLTHANAELRSRINELEVPASALDFFGSTSLADLGKVVNRKPS